MAGAPAVAASAGSEPTRPDSTDAMSATDLPTGAGMSCERATGMTPVRETRPNVGRNAATPVAAAGASASIDALLVALLVPFVVASVSTPTVAAARPDAAAATAPALAPLVDVRTSYGLSTWPCSEP